MFETKTYIKFKNSLKDNFPSMIIVHHSGGTDANPMLDTSNHTAVDMENWHLQKGWEGLGYQYVIQKDGSIWKGRPEHFHGAHTVDHNKDSIGICMSGNFDATLPTEKQISSLVSLMKDIVSRYTIKSIEPHRKYANKSCYGRKLSDTWAKDLLKEDEVTITVPKSKIDKIRKFLLAL